MRRILFILVLSAFFVRVSSATFNRDCYSCVVDSIVKVTYLPCPWDDEAKNFAKYDEKKCTLSKPIDDVKKIEGKIYKISLVDTSNGIPHYKKHEYISSFSKEKFPLLKFESEDGTIFYHVFGYGDFPIVNKDLKNNCDCYLNYRIIKKEDKFNKTIVYYFTIQDLVRPGDLLMVAKHNDNYAVSLSLNSSTRCNNLNGIYILFDDGEVYKNDNLLCEYKYDYETDLYRLSGTLNLTQEEFKRLTEHSIREFKLGSIETKTIWQSTEIRALAKKLMEK